jgi:hypothetical protein
MAVQNFLIDSRYYKGGSLILAFCRADTYIDLDLPGGPDRRELGEIVNWEISARLPRPLKKVSLP